MNGIYVEEVIRLFSRPPFSPMWTGIARLSDGSIVHGIFLVGAKYVPCRYRTNKEGKMLEYPIPVGGPLTLRNFGLKPISVPLYISPLFFVYRKEAMEKLRQRPMPQTVVILKALEGCISRLFNTHMAMNTESAFYHEITAALKLSFSDFLHTLFGIDRATVLQLETPSLLEMISLAYREGLDIFFAEQLVMFENGCRMEDVDSIETLEKDFSIRYKRKERHGVPWRLIKGFKFSFESAYRAATMCRTLYTTPNTQSTCIYDPPVFSEDMPSINASSNSMFTLSVIEPNLRVSAGPTDSEYCVLSSFPHRCTVKLPFPRFEAASVFSPGAVKSPFLVQKWQRLMIYQVLRTAYFQRHDFYLTFDEIYSACQEFHQWPVIAFGRNEMRDIIRSSPKIGTHMISNMAVTGGILEIMHFGDTVEFAVMGSVFVEELRFCSRLFTMKQETCNHGPMVVESSVRPTHMQAYAIDNIMRRKFSVVSGGPGTGKSFVMTLASAVLRKIYPEPRFKFLYLAFTNATVNKTRDMILQTEGNTTENCLFMTCDGLVNLMMMHTAPTFYPTVIFVDEAAQLSLNLMLAILGRGPGYEDYSNHVDHICLFGDANQLPPMQPGSPFREIVEEPVLAPHVVTLTEVKRTGGQNAAVINARLDAIFRGDTDLLLSQEATGTFTVDCSVKRTLSRNDPVYLASLGLALQKAYLSINPDRSLDVYHRTMAVCPVNDVRAYLGQIITDIQFRDKLFVEDELTTLKPQPALLLKGMSVVFKRTSRNRYSPSLSYGKNERGVIVGFLACRFTGASPSMEEFEGSPLKSCTITPEMKEELTRTETCMNVMIRRNGAPVIIPFYSARQLLNIIECGNVVSAHSSQGEEADNVIVCLAHNINLRRRNVLYSMASRAKHRCAIVGDIETIKSTCQTKEKAGRSNIHWIMDQLSQKETEEEEAKVDKQRRKVQKMDTSS